MEVSRVRALRGPNLWSHHTSVEAIVACTPEEESIANLPGFETRLRSRFPQLGQLQPFGHEEDVLDPVPMAEVLEIAALALQAEAGCPVTFSRTTATVDTGIYQVVVEYSEEDVGRLALVLAEGSTETALLSLASLKAGAFDQPECVLAAVAATWALGVPADLIGAGLRTCDPHPKQANH